MVVANLDFLGGGSGLSIFNIIGSIILIALMCHRWFWGVVFGACTVATVNYLFFSIIPQAFKQGIFSVSSIVVVIFGSFLVLLAWNAFWIAMEEDIVQTKTYKKMKDYFDKLDVDE